jgi:hypothetical protein
MADTPRVDTDNVPGEVTKTVPVTTTRTLTETLEASTIVTSVPVTRTEQVTTTQIISGALGKPLSPASGNRTDPAK